MSELKMEDFTLISSNYFRESSLSLTYPQMNSDYHYTYQPKNVLEIPSDHQPKNVLDISPNVPLQPSSISPTTVSIITYSPTPTLTQNPTDSELVLESSEQVSNFISARNISTFSSNDVENDEPAMVSSMKTNHTIEVSEYYSEFEAEMSSTFLKTIQPTLSSLKASRAESATMAQGIDLVEQPRGGMSWIS